MNYYTFNAPNKPRLRLWAADFKQARRLLLVSLRMKRLPRKATISMREDFPYQPYFEEVQVYGK